MQMQTCHAVGGIHSDPLGEAYAFFKGKTPLYDVNNMVRHFDFRREILILWVDTDTSPAKYKMLSDQSDIYLKNLHQELTSSLYPTRAFMQHLVQYNDDVAT